LDVLADRIDGFIRGLQVKGVCDASIEELPRLFKEAGNNDLIPVKAWGAFTEKNGLKGAIDIVDLVPIIEGLKAAYEAVDHVKAEIYEITGLSDIIRGSSDPRETATAVASKGQFGSMRLRAMQGDVVQYATELLRIKAQIMCSQYQDSTLVQISAAMQLSQQDQQLIGPALQLIKQNPLRNFRIEVSSDSMIQMDEAQEKADRMEFMKVVPGYLQGLMQISHDAPKLVPVAVDMLKFAVTGFKIGKQLEGAIDEMADQLRDQIAKQEAAPPPPPPVDPHVQIAQMQIKADGQKTQAEQAFEMQKFQAQQQADQAAAQQKAALDQQAENNRQQYEMAKLAQEGQLAREKAQLDMQVAQSAQQAQAAQSQQENQLEAQRNQQHQANDMQIEKMRLMFESQSQQIEILIARLNNAAKVEVAQIAAAGQLDAAQESAAVQASQDGG
jgi:hypothetical protein